MLRVISRMVRASYANQSNQNVQNNQSIEVNRKGRQLQQPKIIPVHITEAQKTAQLYLQFQALPTDPIQIIKQRFIRKKKLLSNRRYYIPNKKQYLLKLDNMLRQIEVKHKEEIEREYYLLPKTIGEKLELMLKQQEQEMYLKVLKDERWGAAFSLVAILIMAYMEITFCEIL